jgi:hypothetical protein
MPMLKAIQRARRDRQQGKSASTQAGEFVREEIERIRAGVHGARSAKQAIAIGLSMARQAGIKPPAPPGQTQAPARAKTAGASKKTSARRSRAALAALRREPKDSVSKSALSLQGREAAARRGPASRAKSAAKAASTKGPAGGKPAAKKAAASRKSS